MTSRVSVTITCGIQPTDVVTMVTKVLLVTCNSWFTNTYALACSPYAHAYVSVRSLVHML